MMHCRGCRKDCRCGRNDGVVGALYDRLFRALHHLILRALHYFGFAILAVEDDVVFGQQLAGKFRRQGNCRNKGGSQKESSESWRKHFERVNKLNGCMLKL
jgi:hypothetical protein